MVKIDLGEGSLCNTKKWRKKNSCCGIRNNGHAITQMLQGSEAAIEISRTHAAYRGSARLKFKGGSVKAVSIPGDRLSLTEQFSIFCRRPQESIHSRSRSFARCLSNCLCDLEIIT
jgi:hypothetical protein